jgi:hypothetical protein
MEDYLKRFKEAKHPFEEYLKVIHAKDYHGVDDDMPDAFLEWITELDPEEFISHANVFSKMLLDLIK